MKVARLYSFYDIRIEEMPVPEIGPRDALIKTGACGICSGDVMPWYIEKKAPLVIGHEPSGEIVELGRELKSQGQGSWVMGQEGNSLDPGPRTLDPSFKVGDRVFVHHHAPCMRCRHCLRGDFVQCDTWKKTRIIPGGVAEYILIPETNLRNDTLILPEGVSYEDGTLVEPTACVVKSLKRARIQKDDTILVIGLGIMGQLHILLAREFGAGRIIAADLVPFRLAKAMEFGADDVIDVSRGDLLEQLRELTDGRMADIVIVGPNSAAVMEQGMEAAAPGGTVVLFTPAKPGERLQTDPNSLYFRDISIVTSYSCGPDDTRTALGFIERGLVRAERVVTHKFPIEETEKAYRMTSGAGDSLKSLICF
ncbi:MAG: zinc-binding dehydrogenase [Thermodesulfovibrionales bacterium]|jgi:L-iditol 2-dehydrogenase